MAVEFNAKIFKPLLCNKLRLKLKFFFSFFVALGVGDMFSIQMLDKKDIEIHYSYHLKNVEKILFKSEGYSLVTFRTTLVDNH